MSRPESGGSTTGGGGGEEEEGEEEDEEEEEDGGGGEGEGGECQMYEFDIIFVIISIVFCFTVFADLFF
jgi:hypothetical protein